MSNQKETRVWATNRRRFLLASVAGGAAIPAASGQAPQTKTWSTAADVVEALGEPYALQGKRIVFTNWHWIRQGEVRWLDRQGQRRGTGSENIHLAPTDEAIDPQELTYRPVDSPSGIELRLRPAKRIGPLLRAEKPWEGAHGSYHPDHSGGGVSISVIFKEGGVYRGWGSPITTSGPPPGHRFFYYLESHDGLTWTRPNLGLYEFEGSRANNILKEWEPTGTIFIDPSASSAERYKLVAWNVASGATVNYKLEGIRGGVSPDGLRWKILPEPIEHHFSDTQVVGYYDVGLGKYVLYTRRFSLGARSAQAPPDIGRTWNRVARRSIGRTEGEDFRHFPPPETIWEPGPPLGPSDVLYSNARTTVPGAPDHHLLFPTVYHISDDTTSIVMASSHDGKLWHHVPGPPLLTTGPFGAWDGGCIFSHPNLLELPDGTFALPYTGYSVPHKYPRGKFKFAPGYATWPKGRLVAVEAAARGEFATVGVMPPSRKLRLNVLTKRGGSVLVEVAHLDGKPVPGRSFSAATPIVGDHHWTTIHWKGKEDLGYTEGRPIFFRFRMHKAQLFGLEFA